jgi:SH3 domain protein
MRAKALISKNQVRRQMERRAIALEDGNVMVRLRGCNGRRLWYSVPVLLLFWAPWAAAWAGSLYVSDTTLETVLRSGPGLSYRIFAMIQVGTPVTLVSEQDIWAQVTLEDGKTGWVLKKYLTDEVPWRVTAERLTSRNKALQAQLTEIKQAKQDLSEETAKLKKDLDETRRNLESVRQQYETLKKGSSQYLSLKGSFDKLTEEAKQANERLSEVQQGYDSLKSSTTIQWFLSGAGVLVLGWLLGLIMARTRRRRPSELYR